MRILIIDDEKEIVSMLSRFLMKKGFREVSGEHNPERALHAIRNGEYDLIISDLVMEPYDGFYMLQEAKNRGIPFIMMTAHASVDSAVKAMKMGASDYVVKPFNLEELYVKILRIEKEKKLENENELLKQTEIIAYSPSMKRVLELVNNVAPTDFPVLLLGETGVGKTLIAHLIHQKSRRSNGKFVSINVAGIPESLLESELFGYEKGAFTDAVKSKPGMFELADKGTLFLDEIGNISMSAQVKLLKVLEEGTFYRLGAHSPTTVDVRIISATNSNLNEKVKKGEFREDLYYRISVFPIEIPPLRERKEDIAPLVNYYFQRFGHKEGISREAFIKLQSYSWPGNVRELINVVQRAIVLSGGKRIEAEHIVLHENLNAEVGNLMETEKQMIIDALKKTGGNKKEAAKLLGITRKQLYTRLKKYGLM